jgi:hypothetical protein
MKIPFGRPKHRRGDNTKMRLKEIGYMIVYWIYLAQDREA